MNYYNPYYQPMPIPERPAAAAPAQSSPINWVQGIEGAKAFPVAPGNTVLLMDSDGSCFYIKSADNCGMPMPLRTFDYKERIKAPERPQDGFDALATRVAALEEKIAHISAGAEEEGK